MKKINQIGVGLLILTLIGGGVGQAQTEDTLSSINLTAAPVQTVVPDSPVQITAEMLGLQQVVFSDLPVFGTYWEVMPGGIMAPLPNPCFDPSLPTYAITGNIFVVDATYGQIVVNHKQTAMMSAASATAAAVQTEATAVANLIDQVQAASAVSLAAGPMQMSAMDSPALPGFSDGGGANYYTPSETFTFDPGTNLWIADTSVTSGYLNGIASNTLPDVVYTIQSVSDLLQAPAGWQYEGTIVGPELTNWTPLSVAQGNRTNLFIRLRSENSSDGSGIPDWWWQQYGLTNIDPNAQDSAGDGYTIYQKYLLGVAPGTWVTPTAPQNVSANLHQTAQTATVSWFPSAGNATGYTVEKTDSDYYPATVQTFTVTNATSFTDNISTDTKAPLYIYYGYCYGVSYRVQALYSGGNSAWSASVPLQPQTVSAAIAPGAVGPYLQVSELPNSAVDVQLVYVDWEADEYENDSSFDSFNNIPVSAFTNGLYQLPDSLEPPAEDAYGPTDFNVYVRTVDASGNASKSVYVVNGVVQLPTAYNWGMPFYDGRVQLKQNLIFKFRVASSQSSFAFDTLNYDPIHGYSLNSFVMEPTNYVYAGLYDVQNYNGLYGNWNYYGFLNIYLPFEDNYLYRNFVFTPSDVDGNGNMTTGVQYLWGFDGQYNLSLQLPPAYLPTTNVNAGVSLLGQNSTEWLCTYPLDVGEGPFITDPISGDIQYLNGLSVSFSGASDLWTFANNAVNYWGLPFVSAKVYYSPDGSSTFNTILNPGNTLPNVDVTVAYMEAAQPKFQTVKYCFYRPAYDLLPGGMFFSPANDSPTVLNEGPSGYSVTNDLPFVLAPMGSVTQLAGYSKLVVTNSVYSGVYGYLGQYFDKAYQVDANGNITTNTTGLLDPYGDYLPTEVGPAALVTMPDVDTGQQGTCMVYSVSLQLDANHDGYMDLSFNGPDATSANAPFVFWANSNFDRWALDADDNTNYEDDMLNTSQASTCPFNPQTPTPDCNYKDQYGNRMIPCARDLEDFARLWVCGIDSTLVSNLPAGGTISLSWGDVGAPNPSNPTIDIFTAVETDGGIGYLTNAAIADQQANPFYAGCVGRVGPGQSLQLYPPLPLGGNYWQGSHYIWCGVSNGTGGLTLTIADANSNVLAQTTAYIQIEDIKQMYERWTVGENPNIPPTNVAQVGTEDLPVGIPGFQYPLPQNTNTPYILFVHGWNMNRYEKDRFAETAFKRLYWQGYQGRFGEFRWPTGNGFAGWATIATNPTEKDNCDSSEYYAWLSGVGLLNKLNDLTRAYPGQVYLLAHSMGNVVAGEALRLAGSNQVVNTYVGSQSAISAHTYDPSIANYSFYYPPWSLSADTPNIYGNWFEGNNGGGAGQVVSFYNTNDFALQRSVWQLNQLLKPDQYVRESGSTWNYGYNGSVTDPAPWNHFDKQLINGLGTVYFDIVNVLTNRYEVMAFDAQSWTTALGATPGVNNVKRNLDLTSQNLGIWPIDPTGKNWTEHFWHSAQFRGDNPMMQGYWSALLGANAFKLK